MADFLIKNGTIIDGTGGPRYQGDLAIQAGRIEKIEPAISESAKKVIDARGKFVTPGFVDISSHADVNWSLFLNPEQDYLLTQGVTTILVGNCGSSLAPVTSPQAFEALAKWNHGDFEGINTNWRSADEFLKELARRALGLNVATLIGHGTIRRSLTQGQARSFSPEELHQAMMMVEQAISQGAWGLSLGLAYSHEAPAQSDELLMLAKTVARSDGVLKIHLRSESTGLIAAVNEVIQLGRESGAQLIISHLKAIGRQSWPSFSKVLDMIDRAQGAAMKICFDISPYQRTGSFLYLLLPSWARAGGFKKMLERIADLKTRSAIIQDLENQTLHYEKLVVATAPAPNINGRTIQELAERAGQSGAETLLNLLSASRGRVTIFGQTLSFKNMVLGLKHSAAIVASDSSGVSAKLALAGRLVHPRSTGCFPHFLHYFVRERELMSWEEAIWKITGLPAQTLGLKNRGRLAKTMAADIVVFDPQTIRDRSTYQNPYVHSVGIEAVVVNGKLAVENSQLTGTAAGQVLRKR